MLPGFALAIGADHDLSLALSEDGRLLASFDQAIRLRHERWIIHAMEALLAPFPEARRHLRHVIVATGPGSFTGLRIGYAAGAGLATAMGAALAGVRSTRLVAAHLRRCGRGEELLVALAAPRGQIWLERFAEGGVASMGPPVALTQEQARLLAVAAPLVAGTALSLLGMEGIFCKPSLADVVAIPELDPPELLYVRPEK